LKALPFDRQYRLATGLQYELNSDVTLGAAYEYLDLGDADIDRTGGILRGDLKGKYKKNHIHCKFLIVLFDSEKKHETQPILSVLNIKP
jgi:hypothetical protein